MAWRRDVVIAAVGVAIGGAGMAALPEQQLLGSTVYDWAATKATVTPVGEVRQLVRQPTATLSELEMHVTTVKPGMSSHPPHTHANEELVIIDQGTVEVLSNGTWKRIGPGSVVFNASNSPHALRNVGAGPARYHVVNWATPATAALERKQ
jgi:XRE family transcriptional regulator, regulator of sulfur utilization